MKILVISNFYPPHYIGGYELRCKDIVDNLRGRGHKVSVLTSKYRISNLKSQNSNRNNIDRRLSYSLKYPEKVSLKSTVIRELKDNYVLRDLIRELKPDLIYIFNMENLSKSLLRTAENSKIPVLYDISDYWLSGEGVCDNWLTYWQHPPRHAVIRFLKLKTEALITKRLFRKLTKCILPIDSKSLNLKFTYFTSNFLKESYLKSGFKVNDAPIIYCGIPVELISSKLSKSTKPTQLLYIGNIIPHKGAHTVVEMLSLLKKKGYLASEKGNKINLTLVGGTEPEYFKKLNSLVFSENLPVKFIDRIERNKVFKIYKDYDILIFPSVWDEPFSLTLLEGMAAGLPVISTTSGGSREILKNGENCLTFEADNPEDLAGKIEYLVDNPEICEKISINAVKFVRENFSTKDMMDNIEKYLSSIIT